MTAAGAIELGLAAVMALLLETAFPAALRLGGEGPDLLVPALVFAAARPKGSIVAPALLGALRDAASGGVSGRYAVGFLLAGIAMRAAFGRLRFRGLRVALLASFFAALVAHAFAGVAAGLLGRGELGDVPGAALRIALLSAAFAPAIVVALAAAETLRGGGEAKIELGRS